MIRTVLIETLWNVKEIAVRNPSFVFHVLIESKVEVYNVTDLVRLRINRNIVECKDSFFDCPLVPLLVLIETLWNVKSVDHLQVDFSLRINRNIVECKVGIALTCLECSG